MSQACARVHTIARSLKRFGFPFDEKLLPANGIYFLFERGETGHGGDRIVRIGTHSGQNKLRSRLKEHFVVENKDRSIFRKNIGRAMLNRRGDAFLTQWDRDMTPKTIRSKQGGSMDWNHKAQIEEAVSEYIRKHCTFSVIEVNGPATGLRLESRLIATLSLCEECGPSGTWLGRFSPKQKIQQSGLWQVQHLYRTPLSNDDLAEVERLALT